MAADALTAAAKYFAKRSDTAREGAPLPLPLFFSADPNYLMLQQGKAAGEMLMRGFTSARDMAGK